MIQVLDYQVGKPSAAQVQVTYRGKTVMAVAREAAGAERQAIWDRARAINTGYAAYARRIKNRQVGIMILSTGEPR